MSIPSSFEIVISGDPKTEVSIDRFIRTVHRSIQQIDPEVQLEQTNFARLTYRLIWHGITKRMDPVDQVNKTILRKIREELNKWEYKIKLNYLEKEE